MTTFHTDDGQIVLTKDGIDLEESNARRLKEINVFNLYDNMKWVVVPAVEPPSKPNRPCRFCKVPGSYPGERDRKLQVGTVVACTNCGAYWLLVKLGPGCDSMIGREDARWHMAVPEAAEDGSPIWTVVLYEGRNWRGQKVQKPYVL